jgi:hypothetical protein
MAVAKANTLLRITAEMLQQRLQNVLENLAAKQYGRSGRKIIWTISQVP